KASNCLMVTPVRGKGKKSSWTPGLRYERKVRRPVRQRILAMIGKDAIGDIQAEKQPEPSLFTAWHLGEKSAMLAENRPWWRCAVVSSSRTSFCQFLTFVAAWFWPTKCKALSPETDYSELITMRQFMHARALHHVSVWLDDCSTDQGGFPEALDW